MVVLAVLARRRVGAALALPLALALTAAVPRLRRAPRRPRPGAGLLPAPARAWELGAGALLGLFVSWGLRVPRWLQHGLGWLGVALLVAASALIDPTLPFPGVSALVPVGAGVALILAGTGPAKPRVTRLLTMPAARYVGRISYPVYLWHWPVIVISEEVWGRNTLVWVAAPFVSVMLAVLTHHLVEDPLRGRVPARQAYRELIPMLRGPAIVRWAPLKNFVIGSMAYVLVLTSIALVRPPEVREPLKPASTVAAAGGSSSALPANDVSREQAELTPDHPGARRHDLGHARPSTRPTWERRRPGVDP